MKSLMLIPERYRIRCVDELGLIVRKVMIWHKPNGLPESVTDRVRSSHEDWVHLTKAPRYYSAVDEIREPHAREWGGTPNGGGTYAAMAAPGAKDSNLPAAMPHPLGKMPGSVWSIATQPLNMPPHVAHAVCCAGAPADGCRGDDHFAAFPMEWPRRLILGWSPPGICTACGEGRRPIAKRASAERHNGGKHGPTGLAPDNNHGRGASTLDIVPDYRITGYACACTPYTDHPGTGESSGTRHGNNLAAGRGYTTTTGGAPRETTHPGKAGLWDRPKVGPWREYHFDQWTPPPTRPAVVLDPFSGTGTTALVADVLGRHGIGVDLSRGYLAGARWRTTDPGERARAMQVPKPPPPPPGTVPGDDLLSLLDTELDEPAAAVEDAGDCPELDDHGRQCERWDLAAAHLDGNHRRGRHTWPVRAEAAS